MGDEAFRQLSTVDPNGSKLLDKVGVAAILSSIDEICYWIVTVPLHFLLLNLSFRPWLKIKATSGLPNTTDRKLLREMNRATPLSVCDMRSLWCFNDASINFIWVARKSF